MAEITGISSVVASALNEIGLHGHLEVHADGNVMAGDIGEDRGEGVEQTIVVEVADKAE